MVRRSHDRRMDEIFDRLLPPGSMERREYDLPPHLREMLDYHRSKMNALISRCEKVAGSGEFYRRMIEGEMDSPPMPAELIEALGMTVDPLANVSAAASAEDLAAIYSAMIDGDG